MAEYTGDITIKIYDKDGNEKVSLVVGEVEVLYEYADFGECIKNITIIGHTTE